MELLAIAQLGLALLVVLFLPGWLISFGQDKSADPLKRIALCVSTSLALVPLVLLWTSTFGIQLNETLALAAAILVVSASVLIFFVSKTRARSTMHRAPVDAWARLKKFFSDRQTIVVLVIFTLALIARLVAVRGLVAPMWVDSYHHVLITQLIQEHGALPADYTPYAPLASFTYHFGFHANAALFGWLAGMNLVQTVLVLGQVINACAVFAAYLLASSLANNRNAGVGAAFFVGVILLQPAGFVNWGRYTLLTGLVLVPAAFVLAREFIEGATFSTQRLVLAAIALSGLALAHYTAVLLLGCLWLAYYFVAIVARNWRAVCPQTRAFLVRWSVLILATLLLILPWLAHLYFETRAGQSIDALPALTTAVARQVTSVRGYLTVRWQNDLLVVLIALVGAALALKYRKWELLAVVVWTGLMIGLPIAGQYFRANAFPGVILRQVNADTGALALCLPIAVLAGYALAQFWKWAKHSQWTRYAFAAFLILICGFGMQRLMQFRNTELELVHPADVAAFDWMRAHTRAEAIVLTNVAYWQGSMVTGTDAGFWLPLLAQRKTLALPAIYSSEKPNRDAVMELRRVASAEYDLSILRADELCRLRAQGVQYIYIGSTGRNSFFAQQLQDAGERVRQIYDREQVQVYEILVCVRE